MGDCDGFSWRRGLRNKVKRFICGYSNLCVRVFLVNSRWLFICDDCFILPYMTRQWKACSNQSKMLVQHYLYIPKQNQVVRLHLELTLPARLYSLPLPKISICLRQSKTLRLEKCKPNSDLLKKMKEPRFALSSLLVNMLQAISDHFDRPNRWSVQSLSTCSQVLEIVFWGF